MKKTGVIFFALALAVGSCLGSTNFSYFKNPAGAKPAGMAEACAGLSGELFGLYYNPASISGIRELLLGFTHSEFIQGTRYEYGAFVLPLKGTALGISLAYINNGSEERRDIYGVVTGEFTPYQLIPQVTAATEAFPGFSLGLSLKLPYEVIDDYSSYRYLFDAGVQIGLVENLNAGISILNLSAADNMPVNLKAGLSYTDSKLTLCLDFNMQNQYASTLSLGFEAKAIEMLSFRAGYRYCLGAANDNTGGLTAGFGARFDSLILDYGYRPYGDLGGTHFVSLSYLMK